jgi:hypothetical protein
LKDLGDIHYFLGTEVKRAGNSIFVTRKKYDVGCVARLSMKGCKATSTSLSTKEKFSLHEGETSGHDDSTRYKSVVGALQYLTFTRLDMYFLINKVCQFLHAPTSLHWIAMKKDVGVSKREYIYWS